MSSLKTTNLNMHKWEPTDPVQRTEFNENFQKIDEHAQSVTTQLADMSNKNPIYLTDYGVSHLNTAAQNTAGFQQAIDDAELSYRPIVVPWTPFDKWIDINLALSIKKGNINIYGLGTKPRIRQTVFPNPVFDVLAPNVNIENLYLSGVVFDPTGYYTVFRGNETLASYYSGIWISADNVIAKNIKCDNLVSGVHVVAWDGILNVSREPLKGVSVDNLEVSNVTFGLVVVGVNGFTFNKISGSYNFMNTTMPPHLVYFSQTGGLNTNVIGGDCRAYDGIGGHAYIFKGAKSGEVFKLLADNCEGAVMFLECSDFRVNGVSALNDTTKKGALPSINMSTQTSRVQLTNVILKLSGNGAALGTYGDNCKLSNISIETNHVTNETTLYDVSIFGTNNWIDNIDVKNVGAFQWNASIAFKDSGNLVSRPKTFGNNWGISVAGGTNHKVKNYEVADLGFFTGTTEGTYGPIYTFGQAKFHSTNNINASGIGNQDRLLAFDRTNTTKGLIFYTSSGHTWTRSGSIKVKDERIQVLDYKGFAYLTVNTPNIDLSAGIKYANMESLIVRVIDSNNMIAVRLNHANNMLQIIKLETTEIKLAEVAFSVQIGRRYHLRVKVFGNLIQVYVDDVKLASYTFTQVEMDKFSLITNHGIYGYAQAEGLFDNIEWRSLE